MVVFLEALGIPHKDGEIVDTSLIRDPGPEKIATAIKAIQSSFPAEDVRLYLNTLVSLSPPQWGFLRPAIATLDAPLSESQPVSAHPEDPSDSEVGLHGDRLTTLDHVLIDAAIASVSGTTGALSSEQVMDLVDDVIHLNSKRIQSCFHRGFLETLLGHAPADHPGDNEDRRLWHLAGVLQAAIRQKRHDLLKTLCETRWEEVQSLARRVDWRALNTVPALCEFLLDDGFHSKAVALLSPHLLAKGSAHFLWALRSRAVGLLGKDKSPEADALLSLLEWACNSRTDGVTAEFRNEIERRRVHCLRLERRFAEAQQRLLKLLENPEVQDKAALRGDLGLVRAGLRRYHDVAVPDRRADREAFAATLRRGEADFLKAVDGEPGNPGRAHYCLGVMRLLENRKDDATLNLRRALAFLESNSPNPGPASPINLCRSYLGVLLLERLDPELVHEGLGYLSSALDANAPIPLDILQRALEAATLASEDESARLGEIIFTRLGDATIDVLVHAGLAHSVKGVLVALQKRAHDKTRSTEKRWKDWRIILEASLRDQNLDLARAALDHLEGMADVPARAEEFLRLLDSEAHYDPAWDAEEAAWARARLYSALNQRDKLLAVLTPVFYRTLAKGGFRCVAEAEGILDYLESSAVEPSALIPLRQRLGDAATYDSPNGLEPSFVPHGNVLFLGGDQTQARYDDHLRAVFRQDYPGVTLHLVHPGWGSNWNVTLDWVRQKLPHMDVVVLMPLVRTLLGQGVRTACSELNKPWMACTGRGRASIERSLRAAVRLVPAKLA